MANKAKKNESEVKKNTTKATNKKATKSVKKTTNKAPKESYVKGVSKELKLVKWPTFKEVMKYTVATIVFCVIVVVFFILLNLLMSYIKGLFI